jgi:hypothetical protein
MKLDSELELWRAEWQSASESPVIADLRRRVARESLYMRWLLAGEILVTIVIGGATIFVADLDPRPAKIVLAAATWLFIAVAWIFALVSRKNSWSPVAATTSAYLDLSIRRCRAALRSVLFGAILYAVEMAFCLSWIFHETHSLSPTTIWIVTAITAMFALFLIRYHRRKQAELTYLQNLQQTT